MKIGRNAPCPCGSGKKYKRCCLGKKPPQPQTVDSSTRKRSRAELRALMALAAATTER